MDIRTGTVSILMLYMLAEILYVSVFSYCYQSFSIFEILYLFFFRIGVIFFIVMNQIFGNLSAIDLFIRQKHIFM